MLIRWLIGLPRRESIREETTWRGW
jgi:hypothetical protein